MDRGVSVCNWVSGETGTVKNDTCNNGTNDKEDTNSTFSILGFKVGLGVWEGGGFEFGVGV